MTEESSEAPPAEAAVAAAAKEEGEQSQEKGQTEQSTDSKMPPNEAVSAAAPAAAASDSAKEPLTESDDANVKFISAGQETKVEMGEDKSAADPYPALTKAELMAYANDPTWVRLRWALFILFWLAWLGMLVASVIIIVVAPKCYTPAPKQWWQKGPVYEVYVKSYKDSDGDGIGDLKGIESKLDYIEKLGVSSVWLSPIFASPMKDNGYDISDFRAIDPIFGTEDDFKSLALGLHERGIKLIMDFVPNHTSEEHSWFQKSIKKEAPYTDYYIWKAGRRSQTPNNWQSVFGGSAWEFNVARNEWYLHQFYKEQPDLNLRNPAVVEELKQIMKFWMELGVDGFRMDAVAHMFESEDLEQDENPLRLASGDSSSSSYDSVDHKHTYNLPEVLDLLKEFRETLDEGVEGDEEREEPRVMLTEAYLSTADLSKYYGSNFTEHSGDISHLPLNFAMIRQFKTKGDATASNMEAVLKSYLSGLPAAAWPNNNMGNHDTSRIASRLGSGLTDAMNMILMLLPGTPIVYYGEEIGMVDYANMPSKKDERDPERTPMQWSADEASAGFSSSATPWLPVDPNYAERNVAAQEEDPRSHLSVFRALGEMRQQKSILYGETTFRTDGEVFAFTRVRKGNPGYLVAVNFGQEEATADLSGMRFMSESGTVHVRSFNKDEPEAVAEEDGEEVGKYVSFDAVPLRPLEGLVITFVPQMDYEGDAANYVAAAEKEEK